MIEPTTSTVQLDLAGAVLIDFDLCRCCVGRATFRGAWLIGHSNFTAAMFCRHAEFVDATFANGAVPARATFGMARFVGGANFTGTEFEVEVRFAPETTFEGDSRLLSSREARSVVPSA